ncbi:YbaB/EbfC family nucleoid-associated protein [Streptosporangium sp. NPDC006013]|uniref:YbaB/EbfC family nucleoid-associated protein n=1 Tax=Streptosporangium sp. NPDC006013 TaxID=3155596 RepID=UPI0033A6D654
MVFEFDPVGAGPEEFDKMSGQADRVVRDLAGAVEEIGAVRGEGESADGLVRATVDGGGMIQGIRLDARAMRLGSEGLAEALTDVVRAAQEDARRRTESLLRSALGGETPPVIDVGRTLRRFEEVQESFARSMDGSFAELDRLRRRSS